MSIIVCIKFNASGVGKLPTLGTALQKPEKGFVHYWREWRLIRWSWVPENWICKSVVTSITLKQRMPLDGLFVDGDYCLNDDRWVGIKKPWAEYFCARCMIRGNSVNTESTSGGIRSFSENKVSIVILHFSLVVVFSSLPTGQKWGDWWIWAVSSFTWRHEKDGFGKNQSIVSFLVSVVFSLYSTSFKLV